MIHTLTQGWQWLDDLAAATASKRKRRADLTTMLLACQHFGDPQRFYECWHVAGSKGKGSVSMMLAQIAATTGKRVGVFLSPHVVDRRERAMSPTGFFADTLYVQACQQLYAEREFLLDLPNKTGRGLGWFELMTLWGMLVFRQAQVELAVFEVGLGGRLDATNVIPASLSIISLIEREHTQILGSDIEAIAREKAGIIKRNTPVVLGRQRWLQLESICRQKAQEQQAPFFQVAGQVDCKLGALEADGMEISLSSQYFSRPLQTRLRLLGPAQAENAALAALGARVAWPELTATQIESGLSQAFLPGRFEIVTYSHSPPVVIVFDGAHTQASIERAVMTWQQLYPRGGHLIFACDIKQKLPQMLACLRQVFTQVILTQPGPDKSINLSVLAGLCDQQGLVPQVIPDWRQASEISLSRSRLSGLPILVIGSFYLVGAIKEHLGLVTE